MTLSKDARPRVRAHVAERLIDGEALVVNAERGEILVLNACGAFLWKHLDGEHDVDALVALVREEFDVDAATAVADVTAFVESLAERELLD